ncbi:hypothetical protein PIB30_102430 [Stylosanthes scabra]|uniref:Putative plant transposon protein domain-containing protein n=1 Tax=Stylosanthes scabra TaxID=79078 RepID=A0ABU6X0D0_9FABA|nr:hypothetical protein [Stylosanthes scabra]
MLGNRTKQEESNAPTPRGTEINFDPNNIKRVLKLRKDPIPNAPSYNERKANDDFRLDHILYDMCEEGAEWVRHRDGRPHYLRRSDLEPMPKGWYEFVCRSILPTTNRSELTLEKAMLIHSIIISENINVEEIIAEQIYKFVYKTDISSSLPFPSIIAALCADAKIPAIPDNTLIPQEPPIVAEAMVSTLILTLPCPKSTQNLTNIKKRIRGSSRPSTQGWTKWMIN